MLTLLLSGAAASHAQTLTWTGAGDGVTLGSSANWSPAVVPGLTNDCIVPFGAQTLIPQGDFRVRSLTTGRNIYLGTCLNISVTAGLTLTDSAVITVDNASSCTAIYFNGGVQQLAGNGQIRVLNLGQGGSLLYLQNNASVTIASGITIDVVPTLAQRRPRITVTAGCTLTNQGTISVARSTAIFTVLGDGTFLNSGLLKVSAGTFDIANFSGDLGQFQISPGTAASVTGTFNVSQPLSIPGGATLKLDGNWSSSVPITAVDATLSYSGNWLSSGGTNLTNSTWNVSGIYSTLGSLSRTGGAINLGGTFTGPVLAASASTGDLNLSSITLPGTHLTSSDGAALRLAGTSNLNACTIDTDLSVYCAGLNITGGLTLTSSGKLSIVSICTPVISFLGGVQSVSGTGTISLIGTGSGTTPIFRCTQSASVTIESGLSLNFGSGVNTTSGLITIDAGSSLLCKSAMPVNNGFSLTISGGGTFTSQAAITVGDAAAFSLQTAAWLNSGTITGNNATLSFGGTFASFGAVSRTGGRFVLSGNFLGPVLEASAETGDIVLSNIAASNAMLTASPGKKLIASATVSLNACTLGADLAFQDCAEIAITGGLTFVGGATLTIGESYSCSSYSGLTFSGGTQVVSGAGTIVLKRGASAEAPAMRLLNNASVSLGSGISLLSANLSQYSYINIGAGCTLTSFGSIVASQGIVITGAGTFINEGLAEAAGSYLRIDAAWVNNGTLRVTGNGTLSLGGSYSSLGNLERLGGKFFLGGNFSGDSLKATPATGDITLSSLTLTGVTLSDSGGARFIATGALTLDACTLLTQIQLLPCGTVTLKNGLTLAPGGSVLVDYKGYSSSCSSFAITLDGTQTIQGTGEFVINDSLDQRAFRVADNSIVTIASGVSVRFGPDSTGLKYTSGIWIGSGATLRNEGVITVRQASRIFTITGPTAPILPKLVNVGVLEATAGTLALERVNWTNSGTLALAGAGTMNLGGTYAEIGPVVRSGGTLSLQGTYTGSALTADGSTGELVLADVVLTGTTLSNTPGYKLITTGPLTLNNCTIAGNFAFSRCSSIAVVGDFVLADGAVVSFNESGTCPTYQYARVAFGTAPAQIRGNGEIHLNNSSFSNTAMLTIAPSITIRGGPESPNASGYFSGPLTNLGSIIADSGSLVIDGAFSNQGSVSAVAGKLEIRALTGSAGNCSIAPGTSLVLGGNYTIDTPINITSGRSLTLSGTFAINADITTTNAAVSLAGTWTNNANLTIAGGSASLLGTWINAGSINISGAQLTLGGSYTSLGNFTSSSNQLTYTGTVPATSLTANSSTGDITLKAATLNNVLLQSSDGAKFRVIGSGATTFKGCTLASNVDIVDCVTLSIQNGLTFVAGSELRILNTVEYCSSYAIEFSGTAQAVTGDGTIRLVASPVGAAISMLFAAVTFDSGISFLVDPQNMSGYAAISIGQNASFINKGVLASDPVGSQLAIIGNGPFLNQGLLRVSAWSTLSISNLSGPLGAVSLDPSSTLVLAGTYSISDPLAFSAGGALSLSGTWTNNSTISVDHSTLVLGGTWTNAGTLAVSNSAWTIGGTYPALGNTTGSSNALTYAGTFPGPILEANASTGDITLSTLTLNNTTLRTRDNARINIGLGSAVTMSQCRIETDLRFTFCSTLSVNKGLTLADGITLTFDNPFCNRPALTFTGTTQSVTGRAKLAILDAGSANAITVSTSSSTVVTLGPEIELAFGPTPAGSAAPLSNFVISIGSGRGLQNQGLIVSRLAGKTLTISTGTFQNNGTVESAAGSINITSTLSNYLANVSRLTGGRWIMSGGSLTFGTSVINSIGAGTEFRIQSAAGTSPSFASFGQNLGTFAIAARTLATTPVGGTFSNAGTLELGPAANMQINGTFSFDPASTLRIPIAGLAPPALGKLTATGPITLAGKLAAAFTPPFTPQSGDTTATILSSPSILGAFASTCADGNPASLGVQPLLDSASAPSTLALHITASGGLSPFITQQPADTSAAPNASFSCAASPADATFRWFKDGVALVNGPTGHGSVISGAFSSSLSIAGATSFDSAFYTCSATNSCGTTLSTPARLSVCPGDFNADGLVDDSDFQLFVASYNLLDCADPAMPPACPADLDRSGAVDDADFPIFIISYDALLCP